MFGFDPEKSLSISKQIGVLLPTELKETSTMQTSPYYENNMFSGYLRDKNSHIKLFLCNTDSSIIRMLIQVSLLSISKSSPVKKFMRSRQDSKGSRQQRPQPCLDTILTTQEFQFPTFCSRCSKAPLTLLLSMQSLFMYMYCLIHMK